MQSKLSHVLNRWFTKPANKIKQTIKKKPEKQNPKDEKLSPALNKQSVQKNKG